MALNKVKVGSIVQLLNEKNSCNKDLPFLGLHKDKGFIPTVANTSGADKSKYNILRDGYFAMNGMHVGRDKALPLGLYRGVQEGLISPAYKTFAINEDIAIPEYFYMIFNSDEMARYCAFLCDGDVREGFDWDVFCNIEIELPPLEIQKKYVAIYNAMVANQKSYEKRLDDLKMTCEAYIEELKHNKKPLRGYIEQITAKNERLNKNAVGISKNGFIKPKVNVGELKNYTIVNKNNFVYSPPRINIGSIELYKEDKETVCSPIYVVFRTIDENKLNSDYLNIWLHRKEFFRSTDFYSVATVRNNFDYGLMEEVQIAIPPIEVQKSIADLYNAFYKSKKIIEILKNQISQICPILIKGAMEEAQKQL